MAAQVAVGDDAFKQALGVDDASAFVFARHLLATQEHQTGLANRKHVAVLVTNLNLDTWEHLAHRAKANFGDRIAGKRRVVIFRAKQCNGRRGFREAIGVHETSSDEQLERLFKNRKWHTSATIRKRCQHRNVGR